MSILHTHQFIKWFFFRSSKSAFSRHDNVRASSTLFIWLNENVLVYLLRQQLYLPLSDEKGGALAS
ncbi:hypothetical protein HMPREF0670_02429 [Prevotella sp. oral taxon 317 str. F0108]|nr:hypothetical protein HMPREF0670_02429 [Prevotella sp. oral taxon 317 str. F0108]